ncbi:MAG: hypothetical protein CME06_12755 [Gemmatimonadetes bacterium]|nr:hypothetical protein [Gemmatimonadota bacterium]
MDQIEFRRISTEDESKLRAQCIEGLGADQPRTVFDAVQAIPWFRGDDEVLDALVGLLDSPSQAMRGLALEGLGKLEHSGALGPLTTFVETHRLDLDEAAAAVAVIGHVGNEAMVLFLERVIWDGASFALEIRERAVEALLELAARPIESAAALLEAVHMSEELEKALVEAGRAARRALNVGEWEEKGFATIDAELDKEN